MRNNQFYILPQRVLLMMSLTDAFAKISTTGLQQFPLSHHSSVSHGLICRKPTDLRYGHVLNDPDETPTVTVHRRRIVALCKA